MSLLIRLLFQRNSARNFDSTAGVSVTGITQAGLDITQQTYGITQG